MGVSTSNFNRIIDVSLMGSSGTNYVKTIICPKYGRKPSIEINGTFNADMELPSFNLTIMNLHLDLTNEEYTKIKVSCGYEGNTVTIEGSILMIYPESPGPEGKTVIQCQLGSMSDWLSATVQLNFEAGSALTDILNTIKTKLNASQVFIGTSAKTLNLAQPFMHDGSAREAIAKLVKIFEKDNLAIFMRDTTLCAVCLTKGDSIATHVLKYISAPPQPNAGDERGRYYTTITAPWIPKLRVGDLLQVPSKVYMKNYGSVGTGSTQNIQVTNISFHFGTTGSTNSMTVQGFIA